MGLWTAPIGDADDGDIVVMMRMSGADDGPVARVLMVFTADALRDMLP